ncbi:MAG: hypothetical protein HYZ53_27730 [Planctomycetes bacterium]|nr:hypothetical protein [Planctomycetota bacterium]
MRPTVVAHRGRRPARRSQSARTLALLALAAALAGCNGSGFLGMGPKEDASRGRTVDARDPANPIAGEPAAGRDPALDAAYGAYRRAYLFWNAEEKSFREGMESNPVLMAGAYERLHGHLETMHRYLSGGEKEKFEGYLRRYASVRQSASMGQLGRGVHNEARVLGERIRSEYSPAVVSLVAPEVEGPVYVAAADAPVRLPPEESAAPGESGAAGPAAGTQKNPKAGTQKAGAAAGAGAEAKAPPPEPRKLQVSAEYKAAYQSWQVAHRTLSDALFGEKPDLPALYGAAATRLGEMKGQLPEPEAQRLQELVDDYERAFKLREEGATARRLINQFRLVAGEIEKAFSPGALAGEEHP